MKANVGDYLVVKGTTTERHDQHAEIIEVRSQDGSPPYVVRWLVTGHEATVYPGSDAVVVSAAEPLVTPRGVVMVIMFVVGSLAIIILLQPSRRNWRSTG